METLKLPQETALVLKNFTEELALAFKGLLISVNLYGSASSGEYSNKKSNLNVLIVLKSDCPEDLEKATAILNKWKYRIISPLFMSEEYIKESCDVFPVEFLDIKENHSVLFGQDVFKDISIDTRHLRFQCEHELKTKLIGLKQFYARSSKNKSILAEFLPKAITPLIHILRNSIHIKGGRTPYSKTEAIDLIGREYGIDSGLWRDVLAAKSGLQAIRPGDANRYFIRFIEDVEKIAEKIDRM